MKPRAIVTAAEMRAAEQRAIEAGTSVETLMERAGEAVAEAIWRYAGPMPALILCGPGNNGGDGYVVARILRERGMEVRVAASAEPRTLAAAAASSRWGGEVGEMHAAKPARLLVDALFGTGLARPLDPPLSRMLDGLAARASVRVAIDLPSGCASDDGALLSPVPDYDLTIALGSLRPSHLLQPAARHMGRIAVAEIGVECRSDLIEIARPTTRIPGPDDHKYSRGYVAVLAGQMPGAAALAASAAARAGAGYVRLVAPSRIANVPSAVVQSGGNAAELIRDDRIGALVIGPGLGRGEEARLLLDRALGSALPLILDGDALMLLELPLTCPHMPILTPHAGEFSRLFGALGGSKVDQAREAARRSGGVVVFKGADTVVAAPDGRAAIAGSPCHWLASAGTGDVLAGIAAAMRASGMDAFEAACASVWLHDRAGEEAGAGLIADDLLARLPAMIGGPA